MGWMDTLRRYRRTTIGPFWASLSVAVFIGTVGVVYSQVFGQDITTYLPFLCSGYVVWAPLATFITECSGVFTGAEGLLKQTRIPFTVFVYSAVVRNLIVFIHNIVVYIIVAIAFKVQISLAVFLIFPALLLLVVNAVWVGILIGLVCARFRDVSQMVSALTQVAFFVTPIFWSAGQVSGWRKLMVDANPLFHLIDILRSPLLGLYPAPESWLAAVLIAIVGWAGTLRIYNKYHSRIVYWI